MADNIPTVNPILVEDVDSIERGKIHGKARVRMNDQNEEIDSRNIEDIETRLNVEGTQPKLSSSKIETLEKARQKRKQNMTLEKENHKKYKDTKLKQMGLLVSVLENISSYFNANPVLGIERNKTLNQENVALPGEKSLHSTEDVKMISSIHRTTPKLHSVKF